MLKRAWPAVCLIAFLSSCVKDRVTELTPVSNTDTAEHIHINEFVATGSTLVNEFGAAADWIELYNDAGTDITLPSKTYFLSDDPLAKGKFALPALKIKAHDFLIVFCDDSNTVKTQVHANFGLSKSGEALVLNRVKAPGDTVQIDLFSYPPQTAGNSMGKIPDGKGPWKVCVPTPGQVNRQ